MKVAIAAVTPVRQRTQYSCMSASAAMAFNALGYTTTEDEVNKVMGAAPMRGAAWEQALACSQHYGCRATLTVPSTVRQLKDWTDAGKPVMIAWNPEGRDWSHASLAYEVSEGLPAILPEYVTVEGTGPGLYVWVADPNIPHPEKMVRIVHEDAFYKKWYEKWPNYMVRRPAMAIEREITADGRQVMASFIPDEVKKLFGLPPFNSGSNIAYMDSYQGSHLCREYGVKNTDQLAKMFDISFAQINKGQSDVMSKWAGKPASSSVGAFDWKALGAALRGAFSKTRVPAKLVTGEEFSPEGLVTIDLQFGFDYADRPGWDDDKVSELIHKTALSHGLKPVGFPGETYLAPDGKTIVIGVMASSSGGARVRLAGKPSPSRVAAAYTGASKDVLLKLQPEYGRKEYGPEFVTNIMRHPGNGAHSTRTLDVDKGRSRKEKFKKDYRSIEGSDEPSVTRVLASFNSDS